MYKNIRAAVTADFDAVNQFIVDQLHSDVALVESIGHYIVDAGGKRMRPVLVLLSAKSCGFSGDAHIRLAAVIEFIHTATLLHDDVVDMSSMRRGRPTANEQWSNPSSVLVGDFIYSRAFQVLVCLGSMEIMRIIADTTNKIAEGEVLQLINKHNSAATEAGYMNVIRDKTAILFQAAAECGAILAGANHTQRGILRDVGMHIGMAFQLIDDVLDYDGDAATMGKNIGDDLAEGKPTLPLIHAMRTAASAEAAILRTSIENGTLEQLQEVIAIVKKSGGLEYTRELAKNEVAKARMLLAQLDDSVYRTALEDMADLAINRSS
ncbi:MAG: polyprenyl synthetase family protein [Gammaproteobacteria bacterium]|nr:polyprenyl synthetase family protein [Gammaproteobacteria bacterium]MDP2139420.1 polyprenyl synthetase family protein [Gammaproteobacteria bacterium]MDP2346256.1 polyprenyl synthetase family protein [Gammaproteobacteria bacterium]